MEIRIIKVGGTALATFSAREKIISLVGELGDYKVIIVASAMGRNGFPYATDTLKDLINEQIITKKELARLLSTGETISSIVLSNELGEKGIKAYALSLQEHGIVTDGEFDDGQVISLDNERLIDLFALYDVLVVPGFIAVNENHEPMLFKRGGSDLTAILLAEILDIKTVTLFKEIDGVFPFYPLLSFKIKKYDNLSYEEMDALLCLGQKVLQYDALLEAKEHNIGINIASFNNPDSFTAIGEIPDGGLVLGLAVKQNEIIIATFYGEKVFDELAETFKKHHLYIKESLINSKALTLKMSSSQIHLARRIIVSKYLHQQE